MIQLITSITHAMLHLLKIKQYFAALLYTSNVKSLQLLITILM